jgi:hypothetical protein
MVPYVASAQKIHEGGWHILQVMLGHSSEAFYAITVIQLESLVN